MDLRQSVLNQVDNSLKLAGHLISAHAEQSNLIFSPLSIHVLLGMIAAGSNAPTRDQIAGFVTSAPSHELTAFFSQVVSWALTDGGPVGGPILSAANGLWVDDTLNLKPAFRDVLYNGFRAVSAHADFQNKAGEVREQVNAWGNKATRGLIKDILPPNAITPALTRLILANAVYFKATWSRRFNSFQTRPGNFNLLNGSSVQAPMMSSGRSQYFRAFDGFKVLRLPYLQGGDRRVFSMHIYLPDSINGLPSLRERLCSEPGFIDSHFPSVEVHLDRFLLPKFKINFDFEASSLLRNLGLVLPFEGGVLTEMVESSPFPLGVTGMFHKAFVEVNEQGTVAAAVSGFLSGGGGCPPPSGLEFVADHPFMFVIREDSTGIVLFIGQLVDPLA